MPAVKDSEGFSSLENPAHAHAHSHALVQYAAADSAYTAADRGGGRAVACVGGHDNDYMGSRAYAVVEYPAAKVATHARSRKVLYEEVVALLQAGDSAQLLEAAMLFVYQNLSHDANRTDETRDAVTPLVHFISEGCVGEVCSALYRVLRIVSRKTVNQKYVNLNEIRLIVAMLEREEVNERCADCAELCGTLANFAANNKDVSISVGKSAATVVRCLVLSSTHTQLVSDAACCIQAVGMTLEGKRAFIEADAIPSLLAIVSDGNAEVVTPVSGALHNLSNHPIAAPHFRQFGGVMQTVHLLTHAATEVKRCAAGCLQSLSRDALCLAQMKEFDAIKPLTLLVLENDIGVQVAAIAALLNMFSAAEDKEARTRLKKILSVMITTSCLQDAYSLPTATDSALEPATAAASCLAPSPLPDIDIPSDWLC